MATEGRYGWELPDMTDAADGPGSFLQFADDISDTIADSVLTSYTPSWTSRGGANPINPSSRAGYYWMRNKIVHFYALISFGSSTLGGSGELNIGLPVSASPIFTQQTVDCFLFTPAAGVLWNGLALIDSSAGFTNVRPQFPVDATRSDMAPWASTTGFGGQSIPNMPGSSIQNGGRIVVQGDYFAA